MARVKQPNEPKTPRRMKPAFTPEAKEQQMISLAMDAAEEQLRNGTASSQVITHFLKLATAKERLEKEILEKQKDLITAKTESLNSQRRVEELYAEAIKAMSRYNGDYDQDEEEFDDY